MILITLTLKDLKSRDMDRQPSGNMVRQRLRDWGCNPSSWQVTAY